LLGESAFFTAASLGAIECFCAAAPSGCFWRVETKTH
jgi:hypothetical protein